MMFRRKWLMKITRSVKRWVPDKPIRLVIKSKPQVENRGSFVLVLRGAINTLVGREVQQPLDRINVVESQHVEAKLSETLQPSDEISVVESGKIESPLTEQQASEDSITYHYATLEQMSLSEEQASADALTYQTANALAPLEHTEVQTSEDSILTSEATLITLTFNETQPVQDSLDKSLATRQVFRYLEQQYTHEIPVAYVPVGDETLEIRSLTEIQYATDSLTYQFGALYNPLDVSAYYYVEYVVWPYDEPATLYGGTAGTGGILAETVTLHGGVATVNNILSESITLYGGVASTTLLAPQ